MILRILTFLLGFLLVAGTLRSAIRTMVVPRGIPDRLTVSVFLTVRLLYRLRLMPVHSFVRKDYILASFAPVSLLCLPAVWLILVFAGYVAMFWAVGEGTVRESFMASGSSLLTLGFTPVSGYVHAILAFSEAAIGLTLVALLITYLPTIYGAFERRETAVTLLETEAGSPPSAVEFLVRLHVIGELPHVQELWPAWRAWFADIGESHSSLSALALYRSPQPKRSWVTAAGAVLDTAALIASTIDSPNDPQAELCIRGGYLALRSICDVLGIPYIRDPEWPGTPISISRHEFDAVCQTLTEEGIALKADLDLAWTNFAGWRVNYDTELLGLAALTNAPPAPWSPDRAPAWHRPLFSRRRLPRSAIAEGADTGEMPAASELKTKVR